jgi:pentatricopeptide repeat protein
MGFFAMAVIAAFGHDGLMEAAAEVFRELINLVIAVNLDGLFGGVHHHVAFVAPM